MFGLGDLPRTFVNGFDACTVSADFNRTILTCVSTLGQEQRHFLRDTLLAVCAHHFCAVREDLDGHNTLTCSGAIRVVGGASEVDGGLERSTAYFNPLAPARVDFAGLREVSPPGLSQSWNLQYFYASDVRSVFYDDLVGVSCTDAGATCVDVVDGAHLCFGNAGAGAGAVVSDACAFSIVFVLVHLLGVFIFTAVHPVLGDDLTDSLAASVLVYAVPAAAVLLLMSGAAIVSTAPLLGGAALAYGGVLIVVSAVRYASAVLFKPDSSDWSLGAEPRPAVRLP
ncbi:Hypothetical Protein FCC1311_085972 [Hondaea fermentalgiana]|uniref:Uncharacterized protein n=1 Tax=Hondaea fermentalgiana TaxID=2315210 RepID=A0A2R5GN90_9STRA|nr:Hypothetical Protein FCC1311_085972 [Hondaea fermentalgiana]|eukprot:GBG32372.1 Hypothetical Protein FCC1311_085972 [Hondaea fermentalgiana]